MHKKVVLGTFVLMLLLANFPRMITDTAPTTLYINPLTTIVPEMGGSFAVNLTVFNATDLAGWEFRLYYESPMLNATNITEGPFLKTGGPTFFMVVDFTDNHNITHGRIWATCVMTGTGPGVNGNGILATISFTTKLPGFSILHLTDTLLCDSEPDPQPIPHLVIDGTVKVLIHSIAVVNVTPLKAVVGQGLTSSINVTVANQGESAETFNVTSYANATTIQTETVTNLAPGDETSVIHAWNTTGFAKGNYTISANATAVSGETEMGDNSYTDGTVRVSIPGDVAEPFGIVNILDVLKVAVHFGAEMGEPEYNPIPDVDGNGAINILDVLVISVHFGEMW